MVPRFELRYKNTPGCSGSTTRVGLGGFEWITVRVMQHAETLFWGTMGGCSCGALTMSGFEQRKVP